MRRCWKFTAKERPSFWKIVTDLLPYTSDDFRRVSFYCQKMSVFRCEDKQAESYDSDPGNKRTESYDSDPGNKRTESYDSGRESKRTESYDSDRGNKRTESNDSDRGSIISFKSWT